MTAAVLAHLVPLVAGASAVDATTFAVAALTVLVGAAGVIFARNPVHAALMLVMTLFGVAVLFVEQQANFLAAVQVIVYAGAIVVLFLFVIMFLGVDKQDDLEHDPLRGQRPLAYVLVGLVLAAMVVLGVTTHWDTGARSVAGVARDSAHPQSDVAVLGKSVFTTYLFPFEITAALLVIAVVGAVVLARRSAAEAQGDDRDDAEMGEDPDGPGTTGSGGPEDGMPAYDGDVQEVTS